MTSNSSIPEDQIRNIYMAHLYDKIVKVHLAILADPAKIELYTEEFYQLFAYDQLNTSFALIGASERFVSAIKYKKMFNKIKENISKRTYTTYVPGLTPEKHKHKPEAAIGLFPSATNHLIRGPKFIFAPFPINSTSKYLKFKAKTLTKMLSPFLRAQIIPLAYYPMGGKAAKRTKADTSTDPIKIAQRFALARTDRFFKWFYLEAGSGQQSLPIETIQEVLKVQQNNNETIIPNTIYGGGIRNPQLTREILNQPLIPQVIVIGNISEEDVQMSYRILDQVQQFNQNYPSSTP